MADNSIRYENPAEGVARIVLARPDKHNAINPQMIYDVNAAFDRAIRDESIKVIILGADGRNFSAGHDIVDTVADFQGATKANCPGVSTWSDFTEEYTHGWYAEFVGRTGDYRADAGFTRRTNTNQGFFANRFSTKSNPKATLIRVSWNQFVRYTFDWKGRTQYALGGMNLNAQIKGNVFLYFEAGDQYEKDYEEEFGAKRNPLTGLAGGFFGAPTRAAQQPYFSFNGEKRFNKHFYVYGFTGSTFGTFDYDFGAGNRYPRVSPAYIAWVAGGKTGPAPPLDPGKGYEFDMQVGFEYKPIDPLRMSLDYTKSRLTRSDNGRVAFDTNIFTLRSTYQFSRFTFARVRLDYDTLRGNVAGQLLFGWNPSPGTAFYVGYNDNLNYNGFNPYTGQYERGFARNSRTFFIRTSYLFRRSL